jgi:hypothetical protein
VNKILKASLLITVYLFLIIGFDCLYGFLIGGYATWLHLLLSAICAIAFSFLLTALILSFKQIKTEKFVILFIVFSLIFVSFSKLMYNPLNDISAGDDYVEYESEILEIGTLSTSFFFEADFKLELKDKNNKTIQINIYSPIITYSEGDIVTIREKQGGFGYPIYEIVN